MLTNVDTKITAKMKVNLSYSYEYQLKQANKKCKNIIDCCSCTFYLKNYSNIVSSKNRIISVFESKPNEQMFKSGLLNSSLM